MIRKTKYSHLQCPVLMIRILKRPLCQILARTTLHCTFKFAKLAKSKMSGQNLSSRNLDYFQKQKEMGTSFMCDQCPAELRLQNSQINNLKVIHNENEASFKYLHLPQYMYQHPSSAIPDVNCRLQKCQVCDELFSQRKDLINHILSQHDHSTIDQSESNGVDIAKLQ